MTTFQDVDQLEAVTKEVYSDEVMSDLTNRGTPTLDFVDQTSGIPFMAHKEGKYIVLAQRVGGNNNSAMPTRPGRGFARPGNSRWVNTRWNKVTLTQQYSISEDAMESVGGGESAFIDVLAYEMDPNKGQLKDHRKALNRAYLSDGSAEIAQCGTTTASNVVHLAPGTNMNNVLVGMEVVFRRRTSGGYSTGNTPFLAILIDSITNSLTDPQVTVLYEDGTTPSLTTSSNDGMYKYDSQGYDINGLAIHCAANNPDNWGDPNALYGGLDRGAEPLHQGFAMDAGGRRLDVVNHIQRILNELKIRNENEAATLVGICGFQNYDNVRSYMERATRTSPERMLRYKHTGIQYDNLVLVRDQDANPDRVLFFAPSNLVRYVPRKPRWIRRTGAIWRMQTEEQTGRDTEVYRATIVTDHQLISYSSRSAAILTNTGATL